MYIVLYRRLSENFQLYFQLVHGNLSARLIYKSTILLTKVDRRHIQVSSGGTLNAKLGSSIVFKCLSCKQEADRDVWLYKFINNC
jgi:hypothetical protein